jgi:hypothetical protein
MESEPDGPSRGGDDELSRQREKRTTALLARRVPGFSGLTFGQTLAGVALAVEHSSGRLDVERLLAGQGHDRRIIELVLAYLDRDALHHPSRRTDEALGAMTKPSTVVELPVRRSCATDAAVATDGIAGEGLTRLSSVIVGAREDEEQGLSSARRLQLLRRLQARLLSE